MKGDIRSLDYSSYVPHYRMIYIYMLLQFFNFLIVRGGCVEYQGDGINVTALSAF